MEVGFFAKLANVQAVAAPVDAPIDKARIVALGIGAVLRELGGAAGASAVMNPAFESGDYGAGQKFEIGDGREIDGIDKGGFAQGSRPVPPLARTRRRAIAR